MQKKVLDIGLDGVHLVCIRIAGDRNPYRVYRLAGGRRRQIAKYGDFMSVLCFLREFYQDGVDTMTLTDTVDWAKKRGAIW